MTMFPPMCEKHKKLMTMTSNTPGPYGLLVNDSWKCQECLVIEDLRVAQKDFRGAFEAAPMHPREARFFEISKENCELHKRKSADYGNGEDPFANVMGSSAWGIEPWIGVMVRVGDKIKRLQSLVQNGKLVNESAIDSFRDIATYTQMAQVLFEEYLETLKTETIVGESGCFGTTTYKEEINHGPTL